LTLNPQLFSVWTNRGNTLNRLRRYDEVVASHQRAISLNPNEADAHYNLGLAVQDPPPILWPTLRLVPEVEVPAIFQAMNRSESA
jgi:tetratricopeptide (TPR) repeat protein